jgi:hypothetical protein
MRVADELSPARFSDSNGRQLVVMPQRPTGSLPPARHRQKTPEAQTPQRNPKPKMNDKNPDRKPPATQATSPIDEAMLELAKVKDTLRNAATGLQSAAAKLKVAKQAQRTSDKEIRSVRSTIESLRKVRL